MSYAPARPTAEEARLVRMGCFAGLSAPIVYFCGVVIGGAMAPGYSHAANMISELTMTRAQNRIVIAAIFVFDNIVIAVSGIWTAVAAARLSPVMGLAEGVTIGTFVVWLLVFALVLTRHAGDRNDARFT